MGGYKRSARGVSIGKEGKDVSALKRRGGGESRRTSKEGEEGLKGSYNQEKGGGRTPEERNLEGGGFRCQ